MLKSEASRERPPTSSRKNGERVDAAAWSEDAEQAVLSAMLMDSVAIAKARELVDDTMFYRDGHRRIFVALTALAQRGDAVDPLTLSEELSSSGALQFSGGKDYIGYLVDAVPTAANVEYHAKIVRSKALERRLSEIQEQSATMREAGELPVKVLNWQQGVLGEAAAKYGDPEIIGRYLCLNDQELEELPPIKFVLDKVLPEQSLAELHGAPGSGKSFLALDFAMCVATGRLWNTRAVSRGAVVYVAAEGSAGIGQRSRAWKHARAYSGTAGVFFVTRPVNLRDRADVDTFVSAIERQVTKPVKLIVFDTLARCMIGGDENSSRDMGEAIDGADRIRNALECTILLIHHTRKESDVERGSTALRGAVDAMLALKAEDSTLVLSSEKMKDGPLFESLTLTLEPTLESCVITTKTDCHLSSGRLTKNERVVLESLSRDFDGDGAYSSHLEKASGLKDQSYYRAVGALQRGGYVTAHKEGRSKRYTVTGRGHSAIGDNYQIGDKKVPETNSGLIPPTSHLLEMGVVSPVEPELDLEDDRGEAWEPSDAGAQ
ncbi:MAG TPA: AAA family ATPase [Gemmatimonadaceae bacterium]|nr:AAA family ATPase [Gemmatimonadaceae bacterium]